MIEFSPGELVSRDLIALIAGGPGKPSGAAHATGALLQSVRSGLAPDPFLLITRRRA